MADDEKPIDICCHDSKKWKEMNPTEKSDLRKSINTLICNDLVGINECNSLVYKWCFILNAGGLLGTITLLSLKPRNDFLIYVYGFLILLFLLGIFAIYISNKLESSRLEKDQIVIKKYYKDFQEGRICECYLLENVGKEHNSPKWAMCTERASIALFMLGILIGTGILFKYSKEFCDKNGCQVSHEKK